MLGLAALSSKGPDGQYQKEPKEKKWIVQATPALAHQQTKPFRDEEARCEAAGIISQLPMHNLRDSSLEGPSSSFCPNAPIKSRT